MLCRGLRAFRRSTNHSRSSLSFQRFKSTFHPNGRYFQISDEIQAALASNTPIVALETTIYTHGIPSPENVALASQLEALIRENGAIPATIGILNGVARVGFSPNELVQLLSKAGRPNVLKVSRRDLSYALGTSTSDGVKYSGGTTIAATMILAHKAGIPIFATGGLGGVHRGGENSMDVSADLTELGRTPVAVISSGCKGFLDIPRTLEYLETQGAVVTTFADGRSGHIDFPAFWSRDSGFKSPAVLKDEKDAASLIHAHLSLGLASGLHFANPIPAEAEISKDEMNTYIEEAVRQANAASASGKDNTPFILNKIKELSQGKSVIANRALISSNVIRASLVAKELSSLRDNTQNDISPPIFKASTIKPTTTDAKSPSSSERIDIMVAGALAIDYSCDYTSPTSSSHQPNLHTSNPSTISQSLGGVGHNIARTCHLLSSLTATHFCSMVGDDLAGRSAMQLLDSTSLTTSSIATIPEARTAQYVAINDSNKDLMLAMADMTILETSPPSLLDSISTSIRSHTPKFFITDANWSPSTLLSLLQTAKSTGSFTAYEPVSLAKSTRLLSPSLPLYPQHIIDLITPNELELAHLHSTAQSLDLLTSPSWFSIIDALGIPSSGISHLLSRATTPELVAKGLPQMSIQLLPFIPSIITKLGPEGLLLTMLLSKSDPRLTDSRHRGYIVAKTKGEDPSSQVGGLYIRHFPPHRRMEAGEIVSVNGAGDTFLGALISQMAETGGWIEDCIDFAQEAACMTLRSTEAVSPNLAQLRSMKKYDMM